MQEFMWCQLAEIVRIRKTDLGLSGQDLADLTAIDDLMVERIENGTYIPSMKQLTELSRVLGFDVSELTEDNQRPNPIEDLRKDARNPSEEAGLEHLIKMMLAIRQQINLRKSYENEIYGSKRY